MSDLDGGLQIAGLVAFVDPDALPLVLLQLADRGVQLFVLAADLNLTAAVDVENVGFFCFS